MSKPIAQSLAEILSNPTFSNNGLNHSKQGNCTSLLKITELANTEKKTQNPMHKAVVPQNSTSTVSRMIDNDANSKRIKLKDYMHLNSIEKKNKSKSNISASKYEDSIFVESSRKTNKSVAFMNLTTDSPEVKDSRIKQEPSAMLKQDILSNIQQQMTELEDLAHYIRYDFQSNRSEMQAQMVLFNTLNAIKEASKSYRQIGQRVGQYQKLEKGSKWESNQNYRNKYFWQKNEKYLKSPAKIVMRGMERQQ